MPWLRLSAPVTKLALRIEQPHLKVDPLLLDLHPQELPRLEIDRINVRLAAPQIPLDGGPSLSSGSGGTLDGGRLPRPRRAPARGGRRKAWRRAKAAMDGRKRKRGSSFHQSGRQTSLAPAFRVPLQKLWPRMSCNPRNRPHFTGLPPGRTSQSGPSSLL